MVPFRHLLRVGCLLIACSFSFAKAEEPLRVVRTWQAYQTELRGNPSHALREVTELIPGVLVDLRYATTRNFTGRAWYSSPRPLLRKAAIDRLARIQRELNTIGFGLKIWDAYRPYSVTVQMWNMRRQLKVPGIFLAPPWLGSRHNRGIAVDVTLVHWPTGRDAAMPCDLDDFSARAHIHDTSSSPEARFNRDLLRTTMLRGGFLGYELEWWHYGLADWAEFSVLDLPVEKVLAPQQ
jgi:D-alanyl-D-alanine dipeptidase